MPHLRIGAMDAPLARWDASGTLVEICADMMVDGMLVLDETAKVQVVAHPVLPSDEFRLRIGDLLSASYAPSGFPADGFLIENRRVWPNHSYFESARGRTLIALEQRAEGETWNVVASGRVFVLPTKVNEAGYQRMEEDLARVSRDLLLDLIGKSHRSYELKFGRHPHHLFTREEELVALETVLRSLQLPLREILSRPAREIRTKPTLRRFRGIEVLSSSGYEYLARMGTAVHRGGSSVTVREAERFECLNIPEHRLIHGFLRLVATRAARLRMQASEQVHRLRADGPYRSRAPQGRPSLFEQIDLPRIARLQEVARRAEALTSQATRYYRDSWLADVAPSLAWTAETSFQRSAAYREVLHEVQRFLFVNSAWEGGETGSSTAKLSHRLFEQWVFVRIVAAFRGAGLRLDEPGRALTPQRRNRFLLDIERGTQFGGMFAGDLRLRIRFEPWVLPLAEAVKQRDSLFHASPGAMPWSPDVVIECLKVGAEGWQTVYAIVLDCKYSRTALDQHWTQVAKYMEIRSTLDHAQLVRQLWLTLPGGSGGIVSEDPHVRFAASGATCGTDERVRFTLRTNPAAEVDSGPEDDGVFDRFASGTLNFLEEHFSR